MVETGIVAWKTTCLTQHRPARCPQTVVAGHYDRRMNPEPQLTAAPPVHRPHSGVGTWWWFLVPLLTCGLGTFIMVLIGGITLRSRPHQIAAGGYIAATALATAVGPMTEPQGSLPDWVLIPAWFAPWLIGIAHVLVLQLQVQAAARPAAVTNPALDPAVAAAQWRAQRRRDARALLQSDPNLAADLRIGRPDMPHREYDDGGLIDVNHVSAQWLAYTLEMTAEQAADVVAQRDAHGGFTSADELVVYCHTVTAQRLDVIRDRLVFVPR